MVLVEKAQLIKFFILKQLILVELQINHLWGRISVPIPTTPQVNCDFNANNRQPSSPASAGFDNGDFGFDINDGCDASRDNNSSDDDDLWKKLLLLMNQVTWKCSPRQSPIEKQKLQKGIATFQHGKYPGL
ncbi:hypothetical protein L6164_025422 [Bauhinia variegata]|uniref:Uncharacterized protein n=1 Tax=Bauhinia variegata TaxID=167791 RepID=A0ACB9M0T9_BAUVA|nr:hypothetical protein L6164_025422 [Bauhinia variegata]